MNVICIAGRLTEAPRRAPTETPCLNFTLAVNRPHKSREGTREADFFECVMWGSQADLFDGFGLQKGEMLCIAGEMNQRRYTDASGAKRTAWELKVHTATLTGQKPASRQAQSVRPESGFTPPPEDPYEDIPYGDLPVFPD